MALAGWRGIDTQKPASLSAYGLDSATPPRVYTFSAEHAACTHSNHRALRKEETLRVIVTQVQPILQVAALFRSLTRGIRLLHAALHRISYRYYSDIARHAHPSVYQSQYLSPQHEVHDVTCRYQP